MTVVALALRPVIDVGRCSTCRTDYTTCRCEDWERGRDAARSGVPAARYDLDRPRGTDVR